jgi:hypothetical protein
MHWTLVKGTARHRNEVVNRGSGVRSFFPNVAAKVTLQRAQELLAATGVICQVPTDTKVAEAWL